MERKADLLLIIVSLLSVINTVAIQYSNIKIDGWWAINIYRSISCSYIPILFMIIGYMSYLYKISPLKQLICWALFLTFFINGFSEIGVIPERIINFITNSNLSLLLNIYICFLIYKTYDICVSQRLTSKYKSLNEVYIIPLLLIIWGVSFSLYPIYNSLAHDDFVACRINTIENIFDIIKYIGYILIGDMIRKSKPNEELGFAMFVIGAFVTIMGTWVYSNILGHNIDIFYNSVWPNIILLSSGIFVICINIGFYKPNIYIENISRYCIFIYCCQALLSGKILNLTMINGITGIIFIDIAINSLIIFMISISLAYIFNNIIVNESKMLISLISYYIRGK